MQSDSSRLVQMRIEDAAGMRIGGKSQNEKADVDEDAKFQHESASGHDATHANQQLTILEMPSRKMITLIQLEVSDAIHGSISRISSRRRRRRYRTRLRARQ